MVGESVKIVRGKEVHEKLLKGSEEAASAVSTTFGPYGRNVAITMKYNVPKVTKDGASVAGYIKLEDPIENVAAQLINQAANETAKVAGDGTTSTTVLTNNLVKAAFSYIDKGYQPMQLKRELEVALAESLKKLEKLSKPVNDTNIYNIALVACNGDTEMAKMVTNAFKVVGIDGLVTVTESRNYETTLDATDGIRLDRTSILPSQSSRALYKAPKIAVLDLDITGTKDAMHLLALQETVNHPMLIICNDLTGAAAEIIGYNKSKYNIPLEVIRAPFIAEARKAACYDLACVAGATLLSGSEGYEVTDLTADYLGSADRLEITLRETNIIGRHGDPEVIAERIKHYEEKIAEDKQGLAVNYKKRLAFFTSGAAVIYVGGSNETEVDEKKDRFDDTIRAVRSALLEGYVWGGGITYDKLAEAIKEKSVGDKILSDSLLQIVDLIIENSGIITAKEHYKDVEAGNVIDPTLVIKSTLKNAVGAAIMIFTTDCVVVRNEE